MSSVVGDDQSAPAFDERVRLMPCSNFLLSLTSPGRPVDTRSASSHGPSQAKTVLFDQGDRMRSLYFPLKSVISLVVSLSTGETIEAAMIGRDGAVGISCALDGSVSPSRAVVQISGGGPGVAASRIDQIFAWHDSDCGY
jgi:hypothetical protein